MNRGAEQLAEKLAGHGEQKKFVDRYNEGRDESERIDAPMVSRWCNGKRVPLTLQARRIQDLTDIPMQAWTDPAQGNAAPAAE